MYFVLALRKIDDMGSLWKPFVFMILTLFALDFICNTSTEKVEWCLMVRQLCGQFISGNHDSPGCPVVPSHSNLWQPKYSFSVSNF